MSKMQSRTMGTLALSAMLLMVGTSVGVAQTKAEEPGSQPSGLDKRYFDLAADPCANFAQYSCGNFSKLHSIPADMSSYDQFTVIFENNEKALHSLLEKVRADNPARTANEQKIGDYYASCMDVDAVQRAGLKPIQPDLDQIDALKDLNGLTSLLAHFQTTNVAAFLNYFEQQDFKDARKQIAAVDQGGLGLPERDYYLRSGEAAEKTRKQYVQHITNMLKLLGEPEAKAASDAQSILGLETALAKASMDVASRRDPKNVYHPMTVQQLSELTPQIDWPQLFALTNVHNVTELNVGNPEFFKGLSALLKSTDLSTIKTYLRWQLMNSIPRYAMPTAVSDEQFNFNDRELEGQPEDRALWKRCARATDGALGEALGEVYVKEYFPAESKARTLRMVHDIEDAMDKNIDTLSWMSPETKTRAKEKLRLVANKIGYPEHWRDYSTFKVVRGDAFGNAIRGAEFENRRQYAKIGKPVDRGEWGMSPPTVNAYYDPSMNDINFPAGILQLPMFDPSSSDAVNYGHMGAVVGHELTHGFDDEGRKFDGNGNLSDWWTADDGKKFEAKADCEIKEYGGFTAVGDLKLNGQLTLGENTADNGGIRLAYAAFLEDAKRKGLDVHAKDSTGFSPVQQFFLAYGQNWCGDTRPERLRLLVQTDGHSPDTFRINGVVQNMPEFGEAFGCKTGQPMTPVNACRVW